MKIQPVSENALIVQFGDTISEDISERVSTFMAQVDAHLNTVVLDMTPSYTTVLCRYDHCEVDYRWMEKRLRALATTTEERATGIPAPTPIDIPVWYDPEVGYDLETMARDKGLSAESIVQRHTSRCYRVYAIGFIPGFPFMGQVEDALVTPRRATPRQRVAAGSVGIADAQTSVYPIQSPGGWNIIGRTPKALFTPNDASGEVSLLKVGDRVRFVAIDRNTFVEMGGQL